MIWELLLCFKSLASMFTSEIQWITVNPESNGDKVKINEEVTRSEILIEIRDSFSRIQTNTHIRCERPFGFELIKNDFLSDEQFKELSLYLPYALLPVFAAKRNQSFAITHFAQTLDGRIATSTNDSKWIGNDDNLIHAHRMRALCDAILVGAGTLESDNPRLTVRHVKGNDPVKVIVGGDNLFLEGYHAITKDTILFAQNHVAEKCDVKTFRLKKEKDHYRTSDILKELYKLDISSVYIEGGAFTSSHFLCEKCVDQIQVHIAPKIVGSGITGFSFDGIKDMSEAIQLCNPRFYTIGDGIMFIGEV